MGKFVKLERQCPLFFVLAFCCAQPVYRKVIAAFPYDGENRILSMRSRVKGVDCYIVSRSVYTQRGERRTMPVVPKRIGKIPVHIVDVLDNKHVPGINPWGQEVAVRDATLRGLKACGATANDVFLISDADEVLDSRSIQWLRDNVADSMCYACQLEWNLYSRCWGGRLLRRITFASTVRTASAMGATALRGCRGKIISIPFTPCGYHCSWCFGFDAFRAKIRHIQEADGTDYVAYGKQEWTNKRIAHMFKFGLWLDGSKHGRWMCSKHVSL